MAPNEKVPISSFIQVISVGLAALFTIITTISMFILNDIKSQLSSMNVSVTKLCIKVAQHDMLLQHDYETRKKMMPSTKELE